MSASRRETFEVAGRPRIVMNLPSGDAVFLPGESGVVEVSIEGSNPQDLVVEQHGDRIVLRAPERWGSRWDSFDVAVRMPQDADLEVRVASADVDVQVDLRSLNASMASGDLRTGDIRRDASVETASGDVQLGEVGGTLAVSTASGDVHLRRAGGRVSMNTASGEVRLGTASGALTVSTQSGDCEVEHYDGGDLQCNSTSGDIRIGLPAGRTLDIDLNTLSGDLRSEFSPGDGDGATARLRVKSVSGDIILFRASEMSTP